MQSDRGEVTICAQIQSGHDVIGLEPDIDWANIKGSGTIMPTVGGCIPLGTFNATRNINWQSTARVRVG